MKKVMFESEILSFIRIHHTILNRQLISFIYKLFNLKYNFEETADNVEIIYEYIRNMIKDLANSGKIVLSEGFCSCVNPMISKYDIEDNNYRVFLTRKQQVAIWFHIEKYQDIGTYVFVPPVLSDYETFLYWKNQHNCECFSVVTLESNFTTGDPIYVNYPSISENDILEKDKNIIKRYENFNEYEQNTRIKKEFQPGLRDIQQIYLIDNNQFFQKLIKKGEMDSKQNKDDWLKRNVNCLGVFSCENLYKKIIIPSFVYYDLT